LLSTLLLVLCLAFRGPWVKADPSSAPRDETKLHELALINPLNLKSSARIAPGNYTLPAAAGKAVIEIDGDNVVLDLTGVTLNRGVQQPWEREGIGVHAAGHSHLTIRSGAIRGYRFGILIQGGEDLRVIGSDVSENRSQKLLSTDSHYDEGDWVDIFHLDAWESYGAGLYLKDVRGAYLENILGQNEQNGVMLANVTHATVMACNLSHNSGWGIALYRSSWNELLDNHADWDVRCEGKTYSAGCDSAGVLLIDGSNHNRVIGNSFAHSGDGYFVSKPETGASSDSNYVAFNDGSFSPHIAFESTFTADDQFFHNIADHSDYGFWLGYSRDTSVIDNHIEGSQRDGIAIEHGTGNIIARNQILRNGTAGIHLFHHAAALDDPSREYSILENLIGGNLAGIALEQTTDVTITGNNFVNNDVGVRAQNGSARVVLHANRFFPRGCAGGGGQSTRHGRTVEGSGWA